MKANPNSRWLTLPVVALLTAALTSCETTPVVVTEAMATPAPSITRYESRFHPVLANAGMVVSQNDIATGVGRKILADGGNAVDSAIATAFALAVTLPRAGNIGGSGFMLIHDASSGEVSALDFRSAAPAGVDLDFFRNEDGSFNSQELRLGADAAAIPGTVAGLYKAWEDQGSMDWADLVAPSVALAREGIPVSYDLAFVLGNYADNFRQFPASAEKFLKPDDSTYSPGEIWRQPLLADSLEAIAEGGADAFYRGELAEAMVREIREGGGFFTKEDLATYEARPRDVLMTNYRGHRVYSMPPASGGGLTLLQMLNVLDRFDLEALPYGGADSVHLLAEVMKRSAANRRVDIGDPDFVDVPIEGFLSAELADSLAEAIDMKRATPVENISPANAFAFEGPDTTHLSVVDGDGNAVSLTYTLGSSFGSGYVIPGTGILTDNQIRNFSLSRPEHANHIAPGKRMVSTMTPTIVLDPEGELFLVTGTPGGSRIINVILQVIVNMIDYYMNVAEATAAPMIYQGWRDEELFLEKGFSPDTWALLMRRGHIVKPQLTMGSSQSIAVEDGVIQGAADPRRPNAQALGVQR